LFAGLIVALSSSALAVQGTKIVEVSGNNQSATVGTTLDNPFVVLVTDNSGNPVTGARVNWQVITGGASFPASYTITNSNGLTSNTLTLGTSSGHDKATAIIANNGAAAVFGGYAIPGPAETISIYSGNNQGGTVGAPLPNSLAAICRDKYGNPSAHAQVNWTVLSGGGSVPYSYSLSEKGIATKVLTLGKAPGNNAVSAAINGTSKSVTFTGTGNVGPASQLVISGGNDQEGKAGVLLPIPLKVLVTDVYGNSLSNVRIDWTSNTAGDSFPFPASLSGEYGHTSNFLTLGSSFGVHRATATIEGTSIRQTFIETEGVNAIATTLNNNDQNPYAFQPYFLGLSYERPWVASPLFDANYGPMVTLFNNLGPGVVRFIAEHPVTSVTWDPHGTGEQYGVVSKADIVRLAGFVKAVNWKVIYGIALENSTPAAAASEAAVVAQEFGSNLLGFEIGNEPDNYVNSIYGNPPTPEIAGYTWQDYISTTPVYSHGNLLPSWPAFASAIEAAAPSTPLTGPAGGYGWALNFAASDQASQLSILTRHYYATYPAESPTMTQLLTPDPHLPAQFTAEYQAAQAAGIPGGYRTSECNSVAGTIPGLGDAFGAALWTIDFLFENALYQSSGVNFHGGAEGSGNFSPIRDNFFKVTSIGPDYYGLFAYSMLVKGGKLLTAQVTPAVSTFSAYAVQENDGSTDFILSNKDPNNSIKVGLAPQNTISQATSLLLTAPSLTATSGFELGGSAIKTDGSWEAASNPTLPLVGNAAVVTIPPASAQIVHMQ
jgi:hypothetical protein